MDRVRALRGCSFNVNVWGVGERGVVSRAPSRPRRAGRGREARDQPGPTRHELTADWESHDYLGPETVTVNMLPTSQQISKRGFVMDCIHCMHFYSDCIEPSQTVLIVQICVSCI